MDAGPKVLVVPFTELDAETGPLFTQWCQQHMTGAVNEPVVVDVVRLDLLCAAGITALLELEQQLDGRKLRLVGARPPVQRIVELCQLERWLA